MMTILIGLALGYVICVAGFWIVIAVVWDDPWLKAKGK
jgi:hypothetical protein